MKNTTYHRKGFGLKAEVQSDLKSAYESELIARLRLNGHSVSENGITIKLASVPVHRVRGRVTESIPGTSMSDVRVSYIPWSNPIFSGGAVTNPGAFAHADGSFELPNVPAGDWLLTVIQVTGWKELARQRLEVGKFDVEGVIIAAQPLELKGVVRIEGSKSPSQPMHVQFSPRDGEVPAFRTATVGEDGSFEVPDLDRQPYDLFVYPPPEGGYLKSIKFGEVERMDGILDLTYAQPSTQIVVTMSPKGGEVRGLVIDADGKPAAGSTITLVREAPERVLGLRVTANENGTFDAKRLRPGKYRVYAWGGRLDDVPWLDPEMWRKYEIRSELVDVTEGVPTQVNLKQILLDQ